MKTEQQIRQEIAKRLVQFRNEHKPKPLTQRQMAKLLEVSQYRYEKYEQCKCTMPLYVAAKIADLFKNNKQKHLVNKQTTGT